MLRFLSGNVVSVSDNIVVLDVNGLGFELACTGRAAAQCREGERASMVVYLQYSDAGASLFGFADERERDFFLKLITVKGIGGRMGMNILKSAPAERVAGWIMSSDTDSLSTLPGVGKKTAERLCFEMRRHFETKEGVFAALAGEPGAVEIALEALRSLGFSHGDGAAIFRKLKADGALSEDSGPEELIRMALKELKRN
ncbi:MAG: Holliday junction branch migration protein RuvA [Synergistaceae bacterium]|nr:Holliday junction branch migration protein RuvA [Synergistaceae bacterium]